MDKPLIMYFTLLAAISALLLVLLLTGCTTTTTVEVYDPERDEYYSASGGRNVLDRVMEHLPPQVREHAEAILGQLTRESLYFDHGKDLIINSTKREHEGRRILFESIIRGIWRTLDKVPPISPNEEKLPSAPGKTHVASR